MRRMLVLIVGPLLGMMLLPLSVFAQSTLTGVVRDESGGVLPGVTVEASSPALIEQSRTVVTDEQGRYRIIDLRPGTYQLTFSLTGFATMLRDGVDVPSNLVVTVNADMKVGALEERVTVSGQSPQIDVQQATRTQVLSREFLDSLPTTRNSMAIGYLAPGVRMGVPDIGGSNMTNQPVMRAHGIRAPNGVLQLVDGLSIATLEGNQLFYFDESAQNEITITTSGMPADAPVSGIRINSILRDGGNVVSGDIHLNGTDGGWIADNVTDDLRAKGIQQSNGVARVMYFSGALGGPVMKDRLWFIYGMRQATSDTTVANVPREIVTPQGEILSGIVDSYIRDISVRLTWQATSKHKFAAFAQRVWKRLGQNFVFGMDPRIGTQRDPHHAHNYLAIMKWTATPTNKWLIEVGHVNSVFNWRSTPAKQDLQKPRGTPEWYAFAQRTDTALNINPNCAYSYGCTSWMSLTDNRTEAGRLHTAASATYVTGTHNLKIGFNNNMGLNANKLDRNADLMQNYVGNRPSTVTVFNTPQEVPGYVDYDLGVYAQDSWTLRRLTINPGLRVEWSKASVREAYKPEGRFSPARIYPKQSTPAWGPDYLPRFSAVYDVFGDGKTALKVSAGKYNENLTAQDTIWPWADAGLRSETRNWFDCDLIPGTSTCSSRIVPTNRDDIAQDNEIGPSSNPNWGNRADRIMAAGIERQRNYEYSGGVQHQLLPSLAVSAMYFRRTYKGLWRTDRTLITEDDYTSFPVRMPDVSRDPAVAAVLDPSELITVYNLKSAKRADFGVGLVDYNSDDQSIYNGVELSFNSRYKNFSGFGSWNAERNISVFCSSDDNPNGTNTLTGAAGLTDQYHGELVSNGGRFCDQRQFKVPFMNELKLAGNYTLPYQIGLGVVWMSFPGRERVITYNVPATLFPGGRTNSETIILTKPFALQYPRYNQLDLNFRKSWRLGHKVLTGQLDLFNALNTNTIWSQTNAVGSSLGVITQVLQGRTPRLAFTMKF